MANDEWEIVDAANPAATSEWEVVEARPTAISSQTPKAEVQPSVTDQLVSGIQSFVDQSGNYAKKAAVAGRGAGSGLGTNLNASIQAAAGALDQIVNARNNFGNQSSEDASLYQRTLDALSAVPENYSRAKASVDRDIDASYEAEPVLSALLEIGSSIPSAFLGGAALRGAGVTNQAAQVGTLGGVYGFGTSKKEGAGKALDTATGALTSVAALGVMKGAEKAVQAIKNAPYDKFLAAEYSGYGKPILSLSKAKIKPTPYGLDMETHLGQTYAISKDQAAVLTNPNVRAAITREFNEQPQVVEGIIKSTKQRLGDLRAPLVEQFGDVKLSNSQADDLLNSLYRRIDDIDLPEGNPAADGMKKKLLAEVQGLASGSRDPITGSTQIKLKDLIQFQQRFGNDVFDKKLYADNGTMNGAAKKLWGSVADTVDQIDDKAGSGGQISTINKVFKALYDMEDNTLKGTNIRSLVNPEGVSADEKWMKFVAPFENLEPNVRAELAPEMHNYLKREFPKVFAKAKAMLAVNAGGETGSIGKNILAVSGIRGLAGVLGHFPASVVGRFSAIESAGSLQMPKLGQSLPQAISPSLGNLSSRLGEDSE